MQNEKKVKEFALKYNAISDWDTIAAYTSYFQELFISQNKPMLFKGKIYDIVKVDSNFIVKILDEREDAHHNFLAIITFTSQQFDSSNINEKSTTGLFVIKISKVSTSNPSIKEDEKNNGDDSYNYTHLSDDKDHMLTIFTGSIIDCRLDEIDKSH